jgi:hypothetical protein
MCPLQCCVHAHFCKTLDSMLHLIHCTHIFKLFKYEYKFIVLRPNVSHSFSGLNAYQNDKYVWSLFRTLFTGFPTSWCSMRNVASGLRKSQAFSRWRNTIHHFMFEHYIVCKLLSFHHLKKSGKGLRKHLRQREYQQMTIIKHALIIPRTDRKGMW